MMSRFQQPGNNRPDVCVFPNCVEAVTERLDLPLCDRHLIKVYRSVQSLMDVAAVEQPRPNIGDAEAAQ